MKSCHFPVANFSILLSTFGVFFSLCISAFPQGVPLKEVQVSVREKMARLGLQRYEVEDLKSIRKALEKSLETGYPVPLSEEELQGYQRQLDKKRQERSISDEEFQRRQKWIEDARQGQLPAYSDEGLKRVKEFLEKVEQLMQELAEERQQFDTAMEHKETVETLLQKGFAHREQIKSGQMDITSRLSGMRNGKLENERNRDISIAFDQERQRVDLRDVHRHNPYAGNNTPLVAVGCIGCYKGDNRLLVDYSRYVKADDPTSESVLSIFDTSLQFKGQVATSLWTEELNIIPQYIVNFSENRFPTKKTIGDAKSILLSTTVGMLGSGVTDVTIIEEVYKGTSCKKITFDSRSSDGTITLTVLWIAEEQGYSLRKHHLQISGSKVMNYDELLEVDVALDKDSGIWFPAAWHYERNTKGNLWRSEDGTVKNVVLNKPIPDKIFTMQDIKIIPAGVMVQWNTELIPPPYEARRGALLWDGNDIVTRGMFTENLIASYTAENRSKRLKTMILVNIASISLILAVFLWRYYQRLKQQG